LTAAKFIFGIGPAGELRSDDPGTDLQYHVEYGSFVMDLVRATGQARVPDLGNSGGATLISRATCQSDIVAAVHGDVTLACFFGLFPLCVVLLEVFGMRRFYRVLQTIFTVLALVGIAIGIYGSMYYNKVRWLGIPFDYVGIQAADHSQTRKMRTAHQVLGFIAMILLVVEITIGWFYWRRYQRKSAINAKPHSAFKGTVIGLGWLTLLLGCINGFL